MMEKMRTFLAVSPPEDTARNIYNECASLRTAWSGVRWVDPASYHVTLVFFGDHDEFTVERIRESAGPVVMEFESFEVEFDGIDCFGSPHRPKLFIENVGLGGRDLSELREALRPSLEPLVGWEKRGFRPHLTLGRPRRRGFEGPDGGELLPTGSKSDTVWSFRAREVVLYESILRPEGAEYIPLESWPLKEAS
jgi:RNA 2',3'-cyclic 3'-phosphodiesterase